MQNTYRSLWVIGRASADDDRVKQTTPGPYRQIPFLERLQGLAVTYKTVVIIEDGRLAQPVNPGVQSVRLWLRTGRTADCDRCPGRTAGVASVLLLARDGLSGRQVSQVAQYANQYWN